MIASIAAGTAWAQGTASLAGIWKINGNGWPGDLVIDQAADGALSGTIYGETMRGFHSSSQRLAVLLRGPLAAPIQAFIAEVSADGHSLSGTFYLLNATDAGATPGRNSFSFAARRSGAAAPAIGPPTQSPAGPTALARDFTVFNRPAEFGQAQRFSMSLVDGANGAVTGIAFGDPVAGHYAGGTGTLVFVRMSGGLPYQVFIGRVGTAAPGEISGEFYPLTRGAGASLSRIRYDWSATPAAAITGYQLVFGDVGRIAPLGVSIAACPPGKVAVGAGFRMRDVNLVWESSNMHMNQFSPHRAAVGSDSRARGTMQNPVSVSRDEVTARAICAPKAGGPDLLFVESAAVQLRGQSSADMRVECPVGHKPLAFGFRDDTTSLAMGNHALVQDMTPDGDGALNATVRNRSVIQSDRIDVRISAICAPVG